MDRCPASQIDAGLSAAHLAWDRWKATGALPGPGGLLDQSAAWYEFTLELDREMGRLRLIEAKERERDARAKARRR
ncbi:MAG: hypothetical protein AAFP86_12065 [Planctomycetota bacterium]